MNMKIKTMMCFLFLSLLLSSPVVRGQDTKTSGRAPFQEEVTHDGQPEKKVV